MRANASGRTSLMDRLVNKSGVRSEATIQSDVRILLLDPELGLEQDDLDVQLEAQVGNRRRIDVEVGCTVIEVKRSLEGPAAVAAALTQLAGYVRDRALEKGQRYVGVLTDGKLWVAFHEVGGELQEATRWVATTGEGGAVDLLRWLEGVLATRQAVRPTPSEIADRLGAASSSHALDYATLAVLYADSRDLPTVTLKRELWASLLRSALGTQFTDSDELFLEHTLLVNSAEIIAHLVLGLAAEQLSPSTLLSGDQFTKAGLYGIVDRDFFDWVLEVPGGDGFVTALARRLSRFDWSEVEHDVLKVLYESVISAETRKALGEYYTPDWLANKVVSQVVSDPLNQRVLDPSCGSGTFVFYAVKRFLAAADVAGVPLKDAMGLVSSRVMGIDLHPVAVALARVTYLLALGRERLNAPDRGNLSVPVYLGDSLGWDQRDEDLLTIDHLIVPTEVGDQLMSGELRFADHLLSNSAVFDDLVEALVEESGRAVGKATNRLSEGTVRRLALSAEDLPDLNANFVRLKQLHEADRDHIWSYYIRNVSRPAWLARPENRVDVLVGNPPWLSYRHMTSTMQAKFKSLCQARGFWHNETTATHQDLAGVFVARAVERYLKSAGTLAFVVPNSVLDRDYWGGFRRGEFDAAHVAFAMSWDLRRIRPHLFPRGSGVIFGTRGAKAVAMPHAALIWSGKAPHRHSSLDTASQLQQTIGDLTITSEDDEKSPYHKRFSQGANLVPRLMFRVQEEKGTALGVSSGRIAVRSKRSVTEKKPWKGLPDLTGAVESEFVRPTLTGEQILPFRVLPAEQFVVPITSRGDILSGEHPNIDAYPGLASWVRTAEAQWAEHGTSKLTLAGQIDHMSKLTHQFPIPQTRVVYAKAGMHVAAALVTDDRAAIDHKLYWGAVASAAEGRFLVGILNSASLTGLVRPLMSYGKDERDIDKHVWKLPIPSYDPDNDAHLNISRLSGELAAEIGELELASTNFVTNRRQVRAHIAASPLGRELDALVAQLLGQTETETTTSLPVAAPETLLVRATSGRLPDLTADVTIDVDCEFDRNGLVYLWGTLLTAADGLPEYRDFGTADTTDEQQTAAEFYDWLNAHITQAASAGNTLRWFHYGHVEAHHLQRILGGTATATVLDAATDLLGHILRPEFHAPNGYGLKTLAAGAGAHWRTPGATGADTLEWIEAARSGDQKSWATLIAYNEDDTRALRSLREALSLATSPGWILTRSQDPHGSESKPDQQVG